ncbi:MAG: creatininase family protein [Beijerinckiaceae bacterium]|nr:creatininase family protein [Beijerinckiaceae bacterium]
MRLKRLWAENGWRDFAGEDAARHIAVLPVAAVEQHGPHLPLGTDAMIMEGYLARVMARLPDDLPAVFLPVQTIGQSREHLAFPGTLTLSTETTLAAWMEIAESVLRAGIRKLVIINSHGGNSSVIDLLSREIRVRHGALAVIASWSRFGYPAGLFSEAEIAHGIHGGDIETSLMLAFRPDLVQREAMGDFPSATIAMEREFSQLSATRPAGFGWMSQDLNASGAIGNAGLATREKGEAAAEHGAAAFVELLRDVERFGLERLVDGPEGDETRHLLSTTANAEHLLRSIAELDAGKGIERTLIEP